MADQKPTENSYRLLGGVNQKASLYEMSMAQFLNLRNMDFDVLNALQKRPGQTYAISSGTTRTIQSLFEFIRLSGSSWMVAGSQFSMFYIANGGLTLFSDGWFSTDVQRADMLTFTDKLWIANGVKWQRWDGASAYPVGLPVTPNFLVAANSATFNYIFNWHAGTSTASYMLVLGATHILRDVGGTQITRGIYFAYSYLRNDGYQGPANFLFQARNVITSSTGVSTGGEATQSASAYSLNGFTIPAGYGITAINLWFAVDTIYSSTTASQEVIPGIGAVNTGDLGWMVTPGSKAFCSISLKPNADISKFRFFTAIPSASLFLSNDGIGTTFWSATNIIFGSTFATLDGPPVNGFSGMTGDFFTTYTPKYIEVNQNRMMIGGVTSSPSSVLFSEVGEPEFFNPDNSFEVRTNDGDVVTGFVSFNDQLIIMKQRSFHKVIGDSADNYQLVQISDQYGCLNNNSIVKYDQKVLWLDQSGIIEYNGANHQIISTPIEGIFRRMNIRDAKVTATGVHYPDRKQVWFAIPIDQTAPFEVIQANNITIVYDYVINAWTFFDGYTPTVYALAKQGLTKPSVWRGDESGMIHYFGSSFYSDSGQGITCLAYTRFDLAKENETWIWRRFFLDVATAVGLTGTINGQVFSNYDQSTIQATFAVYQNQFQTRAEMGVVGKAVAAQFSHSSASLPLLINGYSWAKRGLRNV